MFWLKCSKKWAADGPTFCVCNGDGCQGWQIGRSLEAQLCVQCVSAGCSARVSTGNT